eukprot:1161469-Pelagomonas_calceolata.AAC.11
MVWDGWPHNCGSMAVRSQPSPACVRTCMTVNITLLGTCKVDLYEKCSTAAPAILALTRHRCNRQPAQQSIHRRTQEQKINE